MSDIDRVAVVIPVHDEETLLGACLSAVQDAAAAVAVPVDVVVVLDACTDRSRTVAARFGVTVVEIDAHSVGAARRIGVTRALGAVRPREARRAWIASTDADSAVPRGWLVHHLALARAGADVVLGGVRPDLTALAPEHADLWVRTHPPGEATGNVHGANLGVRASTYLVAGGFAEITEHEDVDLVSRAAAAGGAVVSTGEELVATSSRFSGRTPGGYAGYLRALDAELRVRA